MNPGNTAVSESLLTVHHNYLVFICISVEFSRRFNKNTFLLAPFSYLIVGGKGETKDIHTPSPTSGFHIREAINNILCINTHTKTFLFVSFFSFS